MSYLGTFAELNCKNCLLFSLVFERQDYGEELPTSSLDVKKFRCGYEKGPIMLGSSWLV